MPESNVLLALRSSKKFLKRSQEHRRHRYRRQQRMRMLEQLEPRIVLNSDWQNPARPLDVNNNGLISPTDVLLTINRLNLDGSGPLPPRTNPLDFFYDTSGDGVLSAIDSLLLINELNANGTTGDPRLPGETEIAPAGFISLPLTHLPGNPGQIIELAAEMTIGRVEFNEMGVFVVDDAAGNVHGFSPTSPDYPAAVFQLAQRRVLFSRRDVFKLATQVNLPAGQHLRIYVLQASTNDGIAENHLRVRDTGPSTMRVGWEEHSSVTPWDNVGDRGFDDVFVDLELGQPVDDNAAPVIPSLPDQTIPEQTNVTFDATAFDPDLPADSMTYSLDTAPAGASITADTGQFSWTPTEADGPGQFDVVVRATDSTGGFDTEHVVITVLEVNRAPVLAPLNDEQIRPGDSLSVAAAATDPDIPANTLTFSLAAGAPTGASIDSSTGMFRFTAPTTDRDATYPITVVVRDSGSPVLSDSQSFTIRVLAERTPPVFDNIPDRSLDEMTELLFTVSASDLDLPDDTLSFGLVSGPAGLTVSNSGTVRWTPTEAQGPGNFPVRLRVTDRDGSSDEKSFAITVLEVNRAPILAAIGGFSTVGGGSVNFTATATDADLPLNTLRFSLEGDIPPGATIDATTGAFVWTAADNAQPTQYEFIVRVTDNGSPELSHAQPVTINVAQSVIELVEEDRFLTEHSIPVVIGANIAALQFSYDNLIFDRADTNSINDAFEVALVDASGRPVAGIVTPNRDGVFNRTEEFVTLLGAGTSLSADADGNGGTITIDVSHLPAGLAAKMVLRLVNNDHDDTTRVTLIPRVTQVPRTAGSGSGQASTTTPPPFAPTLDRLERAFNDLDWRHFSDVTDSVTLDYDHTAYDIDSQQVGAGLTLRNSGTYPIRGPLLVTVTRIDSPDAELVNFAGILPRDSSRFNDPVVSGLAGAPFFDASGLLAEKTLPDSLLPGEEVQLLLEFENRSLARFGYEVHVIGTINTTPEFTSTAPGSVRVGNTYYYDSAAEDADDDTLLYTLISGPNGLTIDADSGLIEWKPTATDIGTHLVTIRAEDPYKAFDVQTFAIEVIDSGALNRPPVFISDPVVDAYVGVEYQYASRATDPDFDALTYRFDVSPSGMQIVPGPSDPDNFHDPAGDITWIPPVSAVGTFVPVSLHVHDGRGGEATQTYQIYVHPNPNNLPPVIVTEPETTFRLPDLNAGTKVGDVSPEAIEEILARGDSVTRNVSVTLPPDVNLTTADIVLVVDESGSMQEQSWIAEVIALLDASLIGRGIGDNRYAIVGYGNGSVNPRIITDEPGANPSLFVQVFGPAGEVVFADTIGPGQVLPKLGLPADGTYTITVSGSTHAASTGGPLPGIPNDRDLTLPLDFELLANLSTPDLQSRVGWGVHAGTLTAVTDLTFTASAGELMVIDGVEGTGITLQVIDPRGHQLIAPRPLTSDPDPILFSLSGEYTVRLQGSSGPYEVRLLDPLATTDTLTLGALTTDTLQDPQESAMYRVDASNIALFVDRWLEPPVPFSPIQDSYRLRLLDAAGVVTEVGGGTLSGTVVQDLDPHWLSNGRYTLLVDAPNNTGTAPLTYQFVAHDLNQARTKLVPGTSQSVTHSLPSEASILDIDAAQGNTLSLDFSNYQGSDTAWRIVDEHGLTLASGTSTTLPILEDLPIRTGGRYHLIIQGYATATTTTSFDVSLGIGSATIDPYSGSPVTWNESIDVINSSGMSHYVMDLAAGQEFFATLLSESGAGDTITIRGPSSGVLWHGTTTSGFYIAGTQSPRLIAPVDGRYQISIDGYSGLLQLARVETPLPLDQLNQGTIRPGGGVVAYTVEAMAGQILKLSDGSLANAWANAGVAATRAAHLEVTGGTEDGYWGIDYTIEQLEFRPHASRQIILLTDEDRDVVQNSITYDSLFGSLATANIGLHSIVSASYQDAGGTRGGALGFWATENDAGSDIARLFYADGNGGFETLDSDDYLAIGNDGTTVADYVELSAELGGSNWNIGLLRNSGTQNRSSFTSAFVTTLSTLISRTINVGLQATLNDAPATIGSATVVGRVVTFPVTFTGDGDAWNFELEFYDLDLAGTVYGSVPVAIGAGYRYDVFAIDPEEDPISYTLVDGAQHGAKFDSQTGVLMWSPPAAGAYEFTATASDPWGGVDTQTWTVTVDLVAGTDNRPPTITTVPNVEQEVERILLFDLLASDPDGDSLSYQLLSGATTGALAPLGLTLNPATGRIAWRPTRNQLGSHEVTIRVVDGKGGRATESFMIDVTPRQPNSNLRPIITSRPVTSAPVGLRYRYDVDAMDPDGDALRYSLVTAPAGVVIERSSGIVSWVPTDNDIGPHEIIVRATDEVGGVAMQAFQLFVFAINDPPEITSRPEGPAVPGVEWTYQLAANDPNGDVVKFTLIPGENPDSATIDASGLLQWTPMATGAFRFLVEASDGRGGRVRQEFTLPVSNAAPPRIVSAPSSPARIGRSYEYTVVAVDANHGDTVALTMDTASVARGATLTATSCPAEFPNCSAAAILTWLPAAVGEFDFKITAEDGAGGTATQSFTLPVIKPSVPSNPPRITSLPTGPAVKDQAWNYDVEAVDPDGDTLTFKLGVHPSGMTIDAITGLVTWSPSSLSAGVLIEVVAEDMHGAFTTQSFELPVVERVNNAAPQFTSIPIGPAEVGTTWTYDADAFDPDGDRITFSLDAAAVGAGFSIDATSGQVRWAPTSTGEAALVVTAVDNFGGSTSQSITISVVPPENFPPKITSIPTGPAIVARTWVYSVRASDPDGDVLTFSLGAGTSTGVEIDARTGLVTWTPSVPGNATIAVVATDSADNTYTQSFTLPAVAPPNHSSNRPPVFTSSPSGPARVAQEWIYLAKASDADGDALTYTLDADSIAAGIMIDANTGRIAWTPSAVGNQAIAVTATDPTGNATTQAFELPVVRINRAPSINSQPTGPVYRGQEWTYAIVTSDPDDDTVALSLDTASQARGMTLTAGVLKWTPADVGTYAVTITAADGQGGTATQAIQLPVSEAPPASGTAPRFRSLPPRETSLGEPLNYRADAYDPDGGTVRYALTQGAVGMTINPDTGLLSWRPGQVGSVEIKITAIDEANETATQAFTIHVVAGGSGNRAPHITSTPRGPAARNLPYQYPVIAEDPDGDQLTYALDADSRARGMTISTVGVILWTPSTANSYPVTVTVTDPLGEQDTQEFTLSVINNAPPQINSSAPRRLDLGQPLPYTVVATDPNPGDTLNYAADNVTGLAINAQTGNITWTPTSAGRYTFNVYAIDNRDARDTQAIDLLVVDPATNNPPEIIGSPRNKIQFGLEYLWQIPATDADRDPLNFELVSGPTGLTLDNGGLLNWAPTESQVTTGGSPYAITARVNDGRGGTDTKTWSIAVGHTAGNEAPEIDAVQIRAVDYELGDTAETAPAVLKHAVAGRVYQALFAATDPEGDTLTWSLVDAPSGVRIDARGLVDYRPTANDVGSKTIQARATDTSGASDTFTYTLVTRGGNSPAQIAGSPNVHHQRGMLYSTTFTATDADSDPIFFRFVAGRDSHGAALDETTGVLTWTPTTDGTYRFYVSAVDPLGEGTQLVFDVLVDEFGPNDPPQFDDTQPGIAEVGLAYSRAFPATDPDGDTLVYAVEEGPAGLTINSSTGVVTWNPPAALVGTSPLVKLTAKDPANHTARYQFRLPVRAANHAPRFDSSPVLTVTAGAVYRYDVAASDPDNDPLTLAFVDGPGGLAFDVNTGRLTWTTTDASLGSHNVKVTLTDDRISTPLEQAWTITVSADTTGPQIDLLASQTSVNIDTEVSFEVRATDDVAVTERTLLIGDTNIALSSSGFGKFTFTAAGRFSALATAKDAAGNTSTDQLEILVRDPNNAAPTISFVTPTRSQKLTAPTDINLTVTDPEMDLTAVRLLFAPADGSAPFRQFASLTATTGQTLGNLTNKTIGSFDPTNLANGSYILRAVAEDAGFNQSTRDSLVQVEGRLKLGNFNVSFDDLTIRVSGIPITIVRSYDTLDANKVGDFGNGWTLEVRQARTEIDQSTLGGVGSGRFRAFINGTRVVATTPEGTEEGFTFHALPDQTLFGIVLSWKSNFDADPGNNYKLEAPAGGLKLLGSEYLSGYGTTYNPQDPEFGNAFQLTSISEKITYNVNATTGETSSLEDRNGNRIEIRYDGIISSAGRSVLFQRDMQGRIAQITDPRGNSLQYAYDSKGDLVSFTDRMGNTTTMTYHGEPAHYLDSVVDALGNLAVKANYKPDVDDGSSGGEGGVAMSGRLSSVEDATGSFLAFDYDPQGLLQTIRDENGISATVLFDDFGNPVDHTVRGGQRVIRTFDDPARGFPRTETQVIGGVDAETGEDDDLTTTRTYNRWGQVTSETDDRGNTTRYLYDNEGVPYSTINPDGSSTYYSYDEDFNLIYSAPSNGGGTSMRYDDAGQVIEVRSGDFSGGGGDDPGTGGNSGGNGPRGNIIKLKYNQFGEVTQTEDTEENLRGVQYDANGNQISTQFDWVDPNDPNNTDSLTTTNVVAPNDQPTESTSPTGTTRVEFDTLDRPFRNIDQNGLTSESRFDTRGLTIETRTQSLDENGAPVWLISRSIFDEDGNPIYSTDSVPEGTPVEEIYGSHNIYDDAGRMIRTERRKGVDIAIVGPTTSLSAQLNTAGTLITSSETHYDDAGRVWQTIDNYGRKSQTLFDRYGQTIESRTQSFDESGTAVWLTSRTVFDSLGRVLLSSDRYVMPGDTALGAGTSPAFYATATVYDDQGRNIGSQRIADAAIAIVGQAAGLSAEIVSAGTLLYESKSIYDSRGRVIRSISPTGQITDTIYDTRDRQIATVGHPLPAEQVGLGSRYPGKLVRLRSETEFDRYGQTAIQRTNVIQVENADGSLVTVDATDARETRFRYDSQGRQVGITYPDDTTMSTHYDSQGRVLSETNQLGLQRAFEYDTSGRLVAVTLPEVIDPATGQPTQPRYEYAYDSRGNQTLIRDPLGRESRFEFDEAGRQATRTLPLGFGVDGIFGTSDDSDVPAGDWTERFEYDDQGRMDLHVSFEGVVTKYRYDDSQIGGGRLLARQFFADMTAYEAAPNAPAETWTSIYDAYGREFQVEQFTLPPRGSSVGEGRVRLATKLYATQGRLTLHSTPEGAIRYEYDVFGRKTSTQIGAAIPAGQPLSSFTADRATDYTYDALGRLSTVTERVIGQAASQSQRHQYFYDLLGSLDAELADNGLFKDYVYDSIQRLDSLTHYRTDGTTADIADLSDNDKIISFDYTVRDDGRRTDVDELWYDVAGATQTSPLTASYHYTYDNLGRMTDEVFDHWDNSLDYRESFTYDIVGNRIAKAKDAGNDGTVDARTSYTFDAGDRLLEELVTDAAGATTETTKHTYEFTQNTGRTRISPSSNLPLHSSNFSYDLQGRLEIATVTSYDASGNAASITRSTYDYDHTGIRISALNEIDSDADGTFESRTKVEYLVDHQNHTGYQQVVRESHYDAATGQLVKVIDYTFGHDEISQTVVSYSADGTEASRETLWFLHDGKANVRGLLDATAAIVQLFSYSAYGEILAIIDAAGVLQPHASSLTSVLYNGEQFDSLTGNQYLRARYYNPANAQFNRLDPFFGTKTDPLSFHKYSYAHGDPIGNFDPTGLFSLGGFSVSFSIGGMLRGMAIGGVTGGLMGAADAWLGGDDPVEGALNGALFGALLGGIAGGFAPAAGAIWQGLSHATKQFLTVWASRATIALTLYGVGDSFYSKGFTSEGFAQGTFRLVTGLFSIGQLARLGRKLCFTGDTLVSTIRENSDRVLLPISDINLGERVHAQNPLPQDRKQAFGRICPSTWSVITGRLASGARIELLRPNEYLRSQSIVEGRGFTINLPGLIDEQFCLVEEVKPATSIKTQESDGSIVTGKITTPFDGDILHLYLESGDCIKCTENHRFFEDRSGSYLAARELEAGDLLWCSDTETVKLVGIERKPTSQLLYNLEVDRECVYHVGSVGVVAHNAYFISTKDGAGAANMWRNSTRGRFSRGEGNVAVADIRMPGAADGAERVIAHSTNRSLRGTVATPTNPKYSPRSVNPGRPHDFDSEVKILESVAAKIDGGELRPTGAVSIYTEKVPCPSCSHASATDPGIMQQFSRDYPDIELNVTWSDPTPGSMIIRNGITEFFGSL
ncbi:MAG: putative Ig domain-containing protein [Pirellulaceae bacterium]